MAMKVGELYGELKLDKSQFDRALATSGSNFGKFVNVIKTGALVAGAAVAGIAAGSLKLAADFDAAMTESLAIMGDVSDEMRAKMESAARDVAKTTTFSAEQAAESYFFLASAGLDASSSIEAMPVVAQFAQAGMFDMARATDLLTDAQSALGMTIRDDAVANMENMVRVSDVLVRANVLSNATVEQFSESLTNRAGAALKTLNKDVEEGVAVLAAFADQGVKGEVAGQALFMVLRDLQTANIKNREAWEEHGVAVYDANGKMRNMADIIGDLEPLLGGMSDEQKKMTLAQLGFTDRSQGYILTLLGTSDAMRNYEEQLRSASGFTDEVAGKQLESFSARMTLMWHKIEDVGISIGQILLPHMMAAADAVGEWFDANEELITSLAEGLFGALGTVVGIIGNLLGLVGDLISAVSDLVSGPLEALSGTAEGIATDILPVLEEAWTTLVEEVFPVVAEAIGELVDIYLAYMADQITWFTETVLPLLIDTFTMVAEDVIPMLVDAFTWVSDNVIPAIGAAFTWITENIVPAMRAVFEGVVKWFQDNWPLIRDIVKQVFGAVATAFEVVKNVIAAVVPVIWGILEPVGEVLLPLIGAAASALLEVIKFVFDAIGVVWQATADAAGIIGEAIGAAFEWLGDFFEGLWDGVTGTFKGAINFIIDLVNGFLKFLNDIHIDIPRVNIPGTDIGVGGGAIDPFNIPLIPHLATGVRGFKGGLALVGENGPELVAMPRGTDVYNAAETAGMMRGKVEVTVRDPDGAIARGGYSQSQIEEMLSEGLSALVAGTKHRSLRAGA